MNRQQLVSLIADKLDTSKAAAEAALRAVLLSIEDGLEQDGEVNIVGFGRLEAHQRNAKVGRHPVTREPMHIPPCRAVKFRPSEYVRHLVNRGRAEA